jgi:hypothetical protein
MDYIDWHGNESACDLETGAVDVRHSEVLPQRGPDRQADTSSDRSLRL